MRNHEIGYLWAKDAVIEFPNDFGYIEWLAYSEYKLAFDENKKSDASIEYFNEMIENSLRRYEFIIENCTESHIAAKAVLGKIIILSFTGRNHDADWSAEFEYPDENVKTAEQALSLCDEGKVLLEYLKS